MSRTTSTCPRWRRTSIGAVGTRVRVLQITPSLKDRLPANEWQELETMVGQVFDEPAIIEAEELLEDQAGQELGLSELLGAESVPMRSDGLTGRVVGDL